MNRFTCMALATLALSACTEEQTALDKPPGKYEKTTVSTDEYGTKTKRTAETDVRVDRYGNKSVTVDSKTTQDPKGLFNKTTTSQTHQELEER